MLFRWSILIAVIPNTNHKLLRLAVLLVLAVFILFHSFYLEQWSVKLAHLTKSGISYLCWVLTNKHILQRPCQNSLSWSSTSCPSRESIRPRWWTKSSMIMCAAPKRIDHSHHSKSRDQSIHSLQTDWIHHQNPYSMVLILNTNWHARTN